VQFYLTHEKTIAGGDSYMGHVQYWRYYLLFGDNKGLLTLYFDAQDVLPYL
jgi:hypothetical protein